MRIAIIAPPWVPTPPPAYGGIEAVVDSLATGLQLLGHEVLLFATGDSRCQVPLAYRYDNAMGVGRSDNTVVELLHVVSAYEMAEEFDIVHDHTLLGPAYSAKYPGLAVVTTNHIPFSGGLNQYYKALGSRVPVIAISNVQAEAAVGINLAAVIHHGVNLKEFPVGDGRGGYALFLGRMSPDKGVHTAIEAARRAGVPLKIAAKCRERGEQAYFDEVIKPMLGRDVEYLGEVGREEKLELLGGATCLLNPIAWVEPFGMVMLEALACGTPVVATHSGAAPEIVDDGKTGYLADSPDDLAEAVVLACDLDRSKCRLAAEERFSMEIMVERHLEVYEKVVAGFNNPIQPLRSRTTQRGDDLRGETPPADGQSISDEFGNFRSAMGI
ncbi:MAG: glycosyltransferase family 4 protein [Actinomycetota bacterium]|nr:glycosyltransferase family 4 protein [Actinomycetota bacterium]